MTFNKVDIALPSEIKEYYATTPEEKQAELHADFKNAINAAKIQFEKVSGTPAIEHQKNSFNKIAGPCVEITIEAYFDLFIDRI